MYMYYYYYMYCALNTLSGKCKFAHPGNLYTSEIFSCPFQFRHRQILLYLNVLVGDINVTEKTYLLDCSVVKTVNQNIMYTKIDDCLRNLDIPRENFVLLLSDAANYMTACTAALKVLYPYLFHMTCTAHMLHNCAE